ncbi:MAG: hypothetical protein KAI24_24800, partial [Planctomycetes bacterium]|nr:hypothetical protein [Planctomycetota bacterium]
MNTPLKLAAVVAGLAFGLTTASAQAVATYAVVDLGVLPGDSTSSPWAINSQGDVVGTSTASLAHQVFVYRDGVGLTAVPMPPGVTRAFGRGINDFGQVAMQTSFGPCTGVPGDAWLWTPGVGHSNLGALAGGTADPTSVNNAGMVVGVGEVSSCSRAAFLHDGTGMSVVTAGVAGQINDAGMIAGTGANGAFRYQAGTVTWLGALPNLPVSRGQAIDGQGRVCGVSLTNNGHVCHMFVDAPGVGMTDLGLVGKRSAVRGMASNGAAVGHWDNDLGTEYGFVWTDATGIVDLNTRLQDPSWVILDAFAINDNGQIAAFG